ncbi:hypothetical protein IWW37_002590 [Coemansia sp. RSA 2050]|nr:hypothetical protein IWW37_002590 [Coemansia sp. RSA 2050]
MTCKCLRQENVVRCYEKCGDDHYYKKLAQGEMGQQQIYCSQKRPGEPEDMPIIGSDGPVIKEAKKAASSKPKIAAPAAPPPPPSPQVQQDWDYRNNPVMRGGGDTGMIHNTDVEGAATRAIINAGTVAVSLLATVLLVF